MSPAESTRRAGDIVRTGDGPWHVVTVVNYKTGVVLCGPLPVPRATLQRAASVRVSR